MVRSRKSSANKSTFQKVLDKLNPQTLFAREPPAPKQRRIYINKPYPASELGPKGKVPKGSRYPSSQSITSKYTVVSFLPRNLIEQFRRVANIFFLGIAILQFFPKFATVSPGLVILPLLAVTIITAVKDGYEDVKRHQSDKAINHSVVHVLTGPDVLNTNPMKKKTKTFVRGIKLPKSKRHRARKAQEREAWEMTVLDDLPSDEQAERSRRAQEVDGQWRAVVDAENDIETVENDEDDADKPRVGWKRTFWEDVRVGDFVKIYNDESFPADIVICATSEEEDVAYVETKGLDGETNLKSRHAVGGLDHVRSAQACSKAEFELECDIPDVDLYKLNAAVILPTGEKYPIDADMTLLRGCVLRNTAWVIGVVMYTGSDSKIILNSGETPSKRSRVERQMNPQVLFSICLLGIAGIICGVIDHFHEKKYFSLNAYWTLYDDQSDDNPVINGVFTFLNSLITFQNIIPISLYISIEFVRTAQAALIYYDDDIKYQKTGRRTTARSWNLSDDLGQIEYVFSDKTGTLTQNLMVFQQCSIGGVVYTGDGKQVVGALNSEVTEGPGSKPFHDSTTNLDSTAGQPEDQEEPSKPKKESIPRFHADAIDQILEDDQSDQFHRISSFFKNLALCHTALASEAEDGTMEYMAQSPDEAALVQAAADVGFVFRGKDRNIIKMTSPHSDQVDEFELLNVLEFTSARKRMSVILRKLDDSGKLFLLIKGADNVIFDRLAPGNDRLKDKTSQDLEYFASEGLRTLCLGYRAISEVEFAEWSKDYNEASTSLDDREGKVAEVAARIEHSLTLLGASAIEDKLQDGVPEAIADLKRAGIKVWVATGDKLETAISIGYSASLLEKDTNLIVIRGGAYGTPNSAYEQIKSAIEQFFGQDIVSKAGSHPPGVLPRSVPPTSSFQPKKESTSVGGYSLVIEGSALTHTFLEEWTQDLLLELSTRCDTVICCRVSPLQKAQIVRLIKDNIGAMTLAIGDGANDVSMIQAADIGVGISGEEGLQAVNSSDYAIAQFRYLSRLLFVHGHWSYIRNANMILNFFYKNIVGVAVLFFFQIYCGWSTTYAYDYVYLLLWNVAWTLFPVIAIGLFDRDLNDDDLMNLPELYNRGREGKYFGFKRYLYFVFEGTLQSAIIFFIIIFTYDVTTARSDGYDVFLYEFSTVMVIGAVVVCNEFHGITTTAWTWISGASIAIGPVLLWIFVAIYAILPPNLMLSYSYGMDHYLFQSGIFWLGTFFVIVVALMPRYISQAFKEIINPTDIDIIRAARKINRPIELYEGEETHDINDVSYYQNPYNLDSSMDLSAVTRESLIPDSDSMVSLAPLRRTVTSGSLIDMSTGLTTSASGTGYDFSSEEGGGVAGRRRSQLYLASLLGGRGNTITRRFKSRQEQLKAEALGRALASTSEDKQDTPRERSGTFSSLKLKAGNILSSGSLVHDSEDQQRQANGNTPTTSEPLSPVYPSHPLSPGSMQGFDPYASSSRFHPQHHQQSHQSEEGSIRKDDGIDEDGMYMAI
ncbi:phospholipid-translocating p-type atpase [Phaffia rhodozyma]|uniref:Phospholipid-transporting ATPase n=1 Tax=Phaffia rhodozyma TaxID=264483 RepID=A0A0F7SH74_PHARH|nr:phospholipid-translocating p-type atpase [Phaffia rhodozyma]